MGLHLDRIGVIVWWVGWRSVMDRGLSCSDF